MAKLLIINCVDCGWPRITARKNTKYCYVCRLARNLAFAKDRTFKCVDCGKTKLQVTRNEDLCKECDEYSTPEGVVDHCAFCERDDQRLLGNTTRVCVSCIHDPRKRSSIRTALKHKINAIKSGEVEIPELELPKTAAEKTREEYENMTPEELKAQIKI